MKKFTPLEKYKIIQPIIDREVTALEIEKKVDIPARTLLNWVKQFKTDGYKGLERKSRSDNGNLRSISKDVAEIVRAFALQKPPLLISAIYRNVAIIAKRESFQMPSYDTIYNIVKDINPKLVTLAIEGSKA